MITTPLKYITDLDRDPVKVTIPNLLHSADQDAHRVSVTVCRSSTRQVVDLTGARITGYFIRADSTTVIVPGSVENGAALCVLSAACYAKPGDFALLIKAEANGVVHTIFHGTGTVNRCRTDALADPENALPPLEELMGIIERVEQLADLTVQAHTLTPGSEATAHYQDGTLSLGIPQGDMGVQRQTDWNENDPASPLHILNRTHWMESGFMTMLPETTLTANEDGTMLLTEKPAALPIEGTDCTVTWNGVAYTCAPLYEEQSGVPIVILGNLAPLGGDYTNEPFLILLLGSEESVEAASGVWGMAIDLTGASTATIKLEGMSEVIHTLDEKYLPQALRNKLKVQLNLINADAEGALRGLYINEGYVQGIHSLAFGDGATAQGNGAISLGSGTFANGMCSFAEGFDSKANGAYSHAEGWNCSALGAYSHAEGSSTTAGSINQHVQGKYNIIDSASKYLHIVGNGSSSARRSNAHTLDWKGNAWFAGTVECTGVIMTSLNGTRYQLTVGDDGTLSAAAL